MKTVRLRSIPVGGRFHIPQMGVDGVVEHHGVGSTTVRYREMVKRTKRDKNTGLQRSVSRMRTEVTQWSHGTEVIPGPAPEDMPIRGMQEAEGDSDEDAAPPRRRAPRPEGAEEVLASGKGATWPRIVSIPGRFMARTSPDGQSYADVVARFKGLKAVEHVTTGGGSSVRYEVTAAGCAALLTHMVVHRKDSRRAGMKLIEKLGRDGASIMLRTTASGEVVVVDGEVGA